MRVLVKYRFGNQQILRTQYPIAIAESAEDVAIANTPDGATLEQWQVADDDPVAAALPPDWQKFIDAIAIAGIYTAGESTNFSLFNGLYHLVMRCLDNQFDQSAREWLTFKRHVVLASQELSEAHNTQLRQILADCHMGGVL